MLKLIGSLFLTCILGQLALGHSSVLHLTAKNFEEETNDGRVRAMFMIFA